MHTLPFFQGLGYRWVLIALATITTTLAGLMALGCQSPLVPAGPAVKLHRIGFLSSRSPQPWYGALAEGMHDLGYVEGQSFAVEYRYAEGDRDRLANILFGFFELACPVGTRCHTVIVPRGHGRLSQQLPVRSQPPFPVRVLLRRQRAR